MDQMQKPIRSRLDGSYSPLNKKSKKFSLSRHLRPFGCVRRLENNLPSRKHALPQILHNWFPNDVFEVVSIYFDSFMDNNKKRLPFPEIPPTPSLIQGFECDERFWCFLDVRKSFFAITYIFYDCGLWKTSGQRKEDWPTMSLEPLNICSASHEFVYVGGIHQAMNSHKFERWESQNVFDHSLDRFSVHPMLGCHFSHWPPSMGCPLLGQSLALPISSNSLLIRYPKLRLLFCIFSTFKISVVIFPA